MVMQSPYQVNASALRLDALIDQTYVRDDRPAGDASAPAVWFAYSPNRQGEHPQGHLKSFQGILQADAFAGFDALYARGDILEAACWAHARRKFFEIHQAQGSPIATEALKRIAALYAIEAELRGKPPMSGNKDGHGRNRSSMHFMSGCSIPEDNSRRNPDWQTHRPHWNTGWSSDDPTPS